MKTVYTLLLAGFITATNAFAQWPFNPVVQQSGIRLELTANNRYILMINGQQFNLQGNLFFQDGIPAGRHQVQVGYYTGHGWFRQFVSVYNQFVDFYVGQRLIGRVNFSGHLVVLGYEPLFPATSQCPPVHPQPHWPVCPPVHPPIGQCPPGQFPRPPFPGQYPSFPGGGWGHLQPMSNQEFASLMQVIRNRSFDSDQLLIARQAVRNSVLSTTQIRQIMDLFSFESTKLEFAKFAYDYCFDRQNYFLIYDAFDFSDSISMLEQHIARR
jgi:hypothetical protein